MDGAVLPYRKVHYTVNRIILPNIQHAVTDFYFKKFHRIKKGM
jgi:hypothetical protein